MKILMLVTFCISACAVSVVATADESENGAPSDSAAEDKAELIAQELDHKLLELLRLQHEEKEEQNDSTLSYN